MLEDNFTEEQAEQVEELRGLLNGVDLGLTNKPFKSMVDVGWYIIDEGIPSNVVEKAQELFSQDKKSRSGYSPFYAAKDLARAARKRAQRGKAEPNYDSIASRRRRQDTARAGHTGTRDNEHSDVNDPLDILAPAADKRKYKIG